ncbi:Dyp-type peroxidase [Pelistega sp. MC2]|uniref:Dyp-type peroxidase n=1 Tax=Pelistega sp. MC2 TaxID=1720297 RepID=UPI0008DB23A4|nr:Dyp-type peroxidase [Pelistega sp. MC2]
MAKPQSAIVPDHLKSGIFIEANLNGNNLDAIRQACKDSLQILNSLQQQFPNDNLGLAIGFGSDLWHKLGHSSEGKELKPFTSLGNGLAPATQCDLFIHIQSLQQAVAFALAVQVLATFGELISIQSETHGFRLLENRGFDGFVDGTENPQGDEEVTHVGIIGDDKPDAGGSYVLLQKYQHDLKKWDAIGTAKQEASIGRSKKDDLEFDEDVRLPDSHVGRVNLQENGEDLKIVRRSLPYGSISGEHGLIFCAYCATLHNIETQLKSMFGETDGKTDLLLTHLSKAVRGAYYFVPSEERLKSL